MLIGYSGCFRGGQLLRYHLNKYIDDMTKKQRILDTEDFIYKYLADCMIQMFKDKEYSTKDLEFLVGYKGRLFCFQSDLSITESQDEFYAIGSGSDYAFGSLFATQYEEPEKRIQKALAAAAHFSPSVREPYDIVMES